MWRAVWCAAWFAVWGGVVGVGWWAWGGGRGVVAVERGATVRCVHCVQRREEVSKP